VAKAIVGPGFEARSQGVEHVVVTHAILAPVHRNTAQMRDAAKQGAFLEFVYNRLLGPNPEFKIAGYARAIREAGPQWCILSSGLGQR
jgi:hypothetical protein